MLVPAWYISWQHVLSRVSMMAYGHFNSTAGREQHRMQGQQSLPGSMELVEGYDRYEVNDIK